MVQVAITPVRSLDMPEAYHHGRKVVRNRSIDQETRHVIAWDGEGVNIDGTGKPQSYVLFGSSEGHIENTEGLTTFECLDHIIETGKLFPKALHCGFAFGYDSNMLVRCLAPTTLSRLHSRGWVRVRRTNGMSYTVTYAKGKYFRVTRWSSDNPTKTTVQIFDIFSFFASSFIKAYEKIIGPIPELIRVGKAGRSSFSIEEFDKILMYWELEIQLLKELMEELRRRVFSAGLKVRQWYGPGALASYIMLAEGVKHHMAETPPEVREAARYAYAGGRFELFKIGRISAGSDYEQVQRAKERSTSTTDFLPDSVRYRKNATGSDSRDQRFIYSIDINSAYPYAISQLPSLTEGTWTKVGPVNKICRFGVYHIRLRQFGPMVQTPSPLFHRDADHNISFPWNVEGWYWSPEADLALKAGAEILEGWEYRGATTMPFRWITKMYATRKQWQEDGNGAELALKLCMNSCYGKLAQRIGWTKENQRIPPFHQLEWAGWVTSFTRAKLYDMMSRMRQDQLIAVETDGIYTTKPPAELGIEASTELGGWSVDRYQEIMYVQSGLAWLLDTNGKWSNKRRGLDPCRNGDHTPETCDCESVFSLASCRELLSDLHPHPDGTHPWPVYKGQTTRFLGLGTSLARGLVGYHCVWDTAVREIDVGMVGKRVHIHRGCIACMRGDTAYESAHDTVISSKAYMDPKSYPHSIPWADEEGWSQWREYAEREIDDLSLSVI